MEFFLLIGLLLVQFTLCAEITIMNSQINNTLKNFKLKTKKTRKCKKIILILPF